MAVNRRRFLQAGMAAAAGRAVAQQREPGPARRQNGPKPRGTPAICLYSDQLLKVGYEELAGMIHMLGFDGVELMIQPGGHIGPELADLHLERGIEAMNGSGVDVWAISTSYTSAQDPTLRLALEWGGEMGVPVFRPGHWKFNESEPEARLTEAQRDIANLAAMGRQTGLPRLKMVTARDCYWSKDSGSWKLTECPLGEGMVDWPKFLGDLAKAKFAGPISLQVGYSPKDEFAAIRKDQQFLRKQLAAAYGG